MTMFSLNEAARCIPGATMVGDGTIQFEHVSTDSRAVAPGDLFIALKGERFDAHDFLPEVIARGASAVLVARDISALRLSGLSAPALVVDDTRRALGALAHGWRQRFAIPLAAITGSNGKTTVKELIAAIFAAAVGENARLASAGNFNNEIGLPLTLLRLTDAHRLAAIELGMNHPGETDILAKIAAPTIALINNAQREHQEFMLNVEAVAREHASVIHALGASGIAVFPAQDAYADIWRAAAANRRIIDFALHTETCRRAAAVTGVLDSTFDGTRLKVTTPGGGFEVVLRLLGEHNARNALAATAVALAADVPLTAIKQGLETCEPVKGRLRVERAVLGALAGATVIDDSYNANPDSMRAAIDVLAARAAPRVLVMGDMGEVGDNGPAFHREVGAYARERGIHALYALGEATQETCSAFNANTHTNTQANSCGDSRAYHFDNLNKLLTELSQASFGSQATLLVKGSLFMKMSRVVDALIGRQPSTSGNVPDAH